MSLDQNLFTLLLTPNKDDPNVVDLVDPSGHIHYRKQRVDAAGEMYNIQVYGKYDLSALLATGARLQLSKLIYSHPALNRLCF
jgi:hypothetical protein